MFGIMSFLDGSRHDATIIADMETQLMIMKKDDFDLLLLNDSPLAAKVLRNLAIHLATIVRNMNSQYMGLMQYMFKRG
jgi:CRP-like cAMP-binding protein